MCDPDSQSDTRALPILLYFVLKDIKCVLFTLVWPCFLVVDERRCCAEIAMEPGFLEVS